MKNSDFTSIITSQTDDSSARAIAVVTQNLIETYREILQHTFRFLVAAETTDRTATPGTALYSPASSYYALKSIFYKSDGGSQFFRLSQISEEDYEQYYINSDSGTPVSWYPSGVSSYSLTPAPSDAGTIREIVYPVQTDLSGDQQSIIPNRFNRVLLEGSLAKFKTYEGMPEAGVHQQNFISALDGMIRELSMQYPPLRPTFYGK